MLAPTTSNWIIGALLLVSTCLLAVELLRLISARRQRQPLPVKLWSAIQSWFHAANGGTATTVTIEEWLLGAPVSARRLAIYSGAICLTTLVANSLLLRLRREALIRHQVARALSPTKESARVLKDLPKLYTTIASLVESVNLLKSEAGKNTPTARSTHTSRSSQPNRSQPISSNENGQKELQEFVLPLDDEQTN